MSYDHNATYSPDDNKLRLYPAFRLGAEEYARIKAAGFKWAPKQELFVAPAWTPDREDLLTEMCGEIGDEDTGLVDRAEQRAERFEDYSEKRANDADHAHRAVRAITDNIPMGQPILIGHHSEKHARRDAKRIDDGMRRAVKLWETSKYWEQRAAGAIAHAKYKERPDVRHRRIKTLTAELRKQERTKAEAEAWLKLWTADGLTLDQARAIADRCWLTVLRDEAHPGGLTASNVLAPDGERYAAHPSWTVEQVQAAAGRAYPRTIERAARWIAHYQHRIAYERAMLAEAGGLKADGFDIQSGGRVLVGGEWLVVLRVNKSVGAISSITTTAPRGVHWANGWKYGIEEVKDYRAPTTEEAAKVKAATKTPPLCNYPGEGFLHMTQADYKRTVPKWSDFPKVRHVKATDTTGAHRVYQTKKPGGQYFERVCVYLTDAKRKDPPAKTPAPAFEREVVAPAFALQSPPAAPAAAKPEPEKRTAEQIEAELRAQWTADGISEERQAEVLAEVAAKAAPGAQVGPFKLPEKTPADAAPFEAMREQLRAGGAQVVTAPQLFPTPPELAARMVELAAIEPGQDVLEPSGGTGRIILAIRKAQPEANLTAVEINPGLADILRTAYRVPTHCKDFLQCNGELGTFDRILMNPPFVDAQDVAHIKHALPLLKPGGRLVAICAGGPRQEQALRPLVEAAGGLWEPLPAGTFKESGTGVNAVLLVLDKGGA